MDSDTMDLITRLATQSANRLCDLIEQGLPVAWAKTQVINETTAQHPVAGRIVATALGRSSS